MSKLTQATKKQAKLVVESFAKRQLDIAYKANEDIKEKARKELMSKPIVDKIRKMLSEADSLRAKSDSIKHSAERMLADDGYSLTFRDNTIVPKSGTVDNLIKDKVKSFDMCSVVSTAGYQIEMCKTQEELDSLMAKFLGEDFISADISFRPTLKQLN